jgi:hypothetical protein
VLVRRSILIVEIRYILFSFYLTEVPAISHQKEEIKKKNFSNKSRTSKEKVGERDIFQKYYTSHWQTDDRTNK